MSSCNFLKAFLLSFFCIFLLSKSSFKYFKSYFKVLFNFMYKLKFCKQNLKYLWDIIFIRIKTINKKIFMNHNVMCNYKVQNANKIMKLQIWSFEVPFWRAKNFKFEVIECLLEMLLEKCYLLFIHELTFTYSINRLVIFFNYTRVSWPHINGSD